MHEAELHEANQFVTLTYSPKNLPDDGSLQLRDFQLFCKRLRKEAEPKRLRFFSCGEYGEKLRRPHYHSCIFGLDLSDRVYFSGEGENRLYTSAFLDSVWGLGFVSVGDVTFNSAAYVARYVTKKITGEKAAEHYQGKTPEFVTMSRGEGIGKGWLDKWGLNEVYPHDEVIVRGYPCKPPRFYDKMFEEAHGDEYEKIVNERRKAKTRLAKDNTWRRLRDREVCLKNRLTLLKRGYESDEA